jgi:DNA-binding response OmpR family regulator
MVEVNHIPATRIRTRDDGPEGDEGCHYAGWTLIAAHLRLISPSGEVISIQRNLLRLLLVFLESPGVTLSRRVLLQRVCSRRWDASDRYIDVLVGQLRHKFSDDAASQRIIRTAHGRGYVFMLEVEPNAPRPKPVVPRHARSDRRAAALVV